MIELFPSTLLLIENLGPCGASILRLTSLPPMSYEKSFPLIGLPLTERELLTAAFFPLSKVIVLLFKLSGRVRLGAVISDVVSLLYTLNEISAFEPFTVTFTLSYL